MASYAELSDIPHCFTLDIGIVSLFSLEDFMKQAVIVSAARTPIARAYKGAFNTIKSPSLLGHAIAKCDLTQQRRAGRSRRRSGRHRARLRDGRYESGAHRIGGGGVGYERQRQPSIANALLRHNEVCRNAWLLPLFD
jgi:hypothetical protein